MADSGANENPIVMPKLGLTMSEGLIAEWRVGPGDEVQPGQIMFVVETDKISNEIEAPSAGRITRLLAEAGETLAVGAVVALWTGPAQANVAVEAEAAPVIAALAPVRVASASAVRIVATPLARRLATANDIHLAEIAGTGPRGRIQARDVEAAAAARKARPTAPPVSAPTRAGAAPTSKYRRLIAERLTRSKAEIPHFYLTAGVAFDALTALRRDLNAEPNAPKLTVTAFLVAAVARALAQHPETNVVWREGELHALSATSVGVAVESPVGVLAPVLRDADKFALYDLARAMEAAVARARKGSISAADASEAAISVSNVGMYGARSLTPIIDPDQTFILGVGAPHGVFRPDANGAPKAVQEVILTLACDHRAIDGAAAARLLATLVAMLESPLRLLLGPVS
ncbi:MAG TPA: dihydrolipoamide acetyltransferase family protein [Caulobacterales bacterium]|nr:dihydrolipoamide acetyltransferase family protein [Caulobacterales bacterium]